VFHFGKKKVPILMDIWAYDLIDTSTKDDNEK